MKSLAQFQLCMSLKTILNRRGTKAQRRKHAARQRVARDR